MRSKINALRREERMDFKKHLETAWNLTLKFIAPLIIMTLVMILISVFSLGILWPVVTAGYIYSIMLVLKQDREPKIQDIFSQMHLFFPLLGFAILFIIISMVGIILFFLPGVIFILAVTFFCLYMIPLMVDKKMGLIDAIKKSCSMSLDGEIVDHIVFVVLFVGITSIGNSILIGMLFTLPFATIFLLSAYQEKISTFNSSSNEKTKIESGEAT